MTVEIEKLKALALAADRSGGRRIYTHWGDISNWKANEAWQEAATPEAFIELIAEVERLRAELAAGAARQGGGTFDLARKLIEGHGKTISNMYFDGEPVGKQLIESISAAPAAGTEKDAELSPELQEIHRFLLGEGQLEGVNFGEWHSLTIGEWWWRKRLRAAIGAYTKAARDPA